MNQHLKPERRARLLFLFALVSLLHGLASSPARSDIIFTKIVDTSGPFNNLSRPTINEDGVVAFWAQLDPANDRVVLTSDGTTTRTIATTVGDGPLFNISSNPAPVINNSGRVVFEASASGNTRLLTGDGGPLTTIASRGDTIGPITNITSLGRFSINDAGEVGFAAVGGVLGILKWSGGPFSVVAGLDSFVFNDFSMNNEGAVAFFERLTNIAGPDRVVVVRDGVLTTIADDNGIFRAFDAVATNPRLAMNDPGQVAFWGLLEDGSPAVGVGDGESLSVYTTASGPPDFSFLSINNLGQVAYMANNRIVLGSDPVADAVIRVGDLLDGSTVRELSIESTSLNDRGQLAFRARLADGRFGIYVAQRVPEPVSLTFGGFRFNRGTGQFHQTVKLTNNGPAPLLGPISLVLSDLTPGVILFNADGSTSLIDQAGNPYIDVAPAGGLLQPGESVTVVLQFVNPLRLFITYNPRILAGGGDR